MSTWSTDPTRSRIARVGARSCRQAACSLRPQSLTLSGAHGGSRRWHGPFDRAHDASGRVDIEHVGNHDVTMDATGIRAAFGLRGRTRRRVAVLGADDSRTRTEPVVERPLLLEYLRSVWYRLLSDPRGDVVFLWLAVSDSTRANGCLKHVPGSHSTRSRCRDVCGVSSPRQPGSRGQRVPAGPTYDPERHMAFQN